MGFRQPLTRLSELLADSIVGAVIKTAATGARIELNTAAANVIRFFSGDPAEIDPSTLSSFAGSGEAGIELRSASMDTGGGIPTGRAQLLLAADETLGTRIAAQADNMEFSATGSIDIFGDVNLSGALDVTGGIYAFGVLQDTGWVTFASNVPNVPKTDNYAKYRRVGKTVHVHLNITLTGGIGPALIDVPFAFATGTVFHESNQIGTVQALRAGVAWHMGKVAPITSVPARAAIYMASGAGSQFNAGTPAAWVAGDRWGIDLTYECA